MVSKTRNAREDLLNTAEQLFAEQGIAAVSLRAINTEAGYSVAALHYHFRTKDELVAALLNARQRPITARRAELIAALKELSQPDVHGLVEALVLPFADLILSDPAAGLRTVKFFFRAYVRQRDIAQVRAATEESLRLFDPLLKAVLPFLDRRTRRNRWLLATELTFQALANCETIVGKPNAEISDAERRRYVGELIDFVSGGLAYH